MASVAAATVAPVDFDFEVVGDGYLATLRGDVAAERLQPLWAHIGAERPDGGFRFGVLDISRARTPELEGWPADATTLERLQPIARMIRMTLQDRFRMAVVTTDVSIDAVISDLTQLVRFAPPIRSGDSPRSRRFDTVEEALAWCRGEGDD